MTDRIYSKALIVELIEIVTYEYGNKEILDNAFNSSYNPLKEEFIHMKLLTCLSYLTNNDGFMPKYEDLNYDFSNVKESYRPTEFLRPIDFNNCNFIPLIGYEYFLYRFLIKYPTPLLCNLSDIIWTQNLLIYYMNVKYNCEFNARVVQYALSKLKKNILKFDRFCTSSEDYENQVLDLYLHTITQFIETDRTNIEQIYLGAIVNSTYLQRSDKKNKHCLLAVPSMLKNPYFFNYPPFLRESLSLNYGVDELFLFNAVPNFSLFMIFTSGQYYIYDEHTKEYSLKNYDLNSFTFFLIESRKQLNMNILVIPEKLLSRYGCKYDLMFPIELNKDTNVHTFLEILFNYYNYILSVTESYLSKPTYTYGRYDVFDLVNSIGIDEQYIFASCKEYLFFLQVYHYPLYENIVTFGTTYFKNNCFLEVREMFLNGARTKRSKPPRIHTVIPKHSIRSSLNMSCPDEITRYKLIDETMEDERLGTLRKCNISKYKRE